MNTSRRAFLKTVPFLAPAAKAAVLAVGTPALTGGFGSFGIRDQLKACDRLYDLIPPSDFTKLSISLYAFVRGRKKLETIDFFTDQAGVDYLKRLEAELRK